MDRRGCWSSASAGELTSGCRPLRCRWRRGGERSLTVSWGVFLGARDPWQRSHSVRTSLSTGSCSRPDRPTLRSSTAAGRPTSPRTPTSTSLQRSASPKHAGARRSFLAESPTRPWSPHGPTWTANWLRPSTRFRGLSCPRPSSRRPGNATALGADWVDDVGRLRRELDRDIVVYGSCRLSAALLERGLVDEIRQTVYPLMLGTGDRLFGDTGLKQSLRLIAARTLNHGVVHLVHQPTPPAA